MRHHFVATTERLLPITALLYAFEIFDPLVMDAKEDLLLEGDVYSELFHVFSDDMIFFAGIFTVFWGIFPKPCGMFL